MDAPYYHIETQDFSLSPTLEVVFTLQPGSVCVVQRSADRADNFVAGHYVETGHRDANETPSHGEVDENGYTIWTQVTQRADFQWVAATWDVAPQDYLVALAGVNSAGPGDTIVNRQASYAIAGAYAESTHVQPKTTADLPVLPDDIGYASESGFSFTIQNTVVSNDFAPDCPTGVEPKGLSGSGTSEDAITHSLWTSLRNDTPPYTVSTDDTTDAGALRFHGLSGGNGQYLFPIDGTNRVIDQQTFNGDPFDGSVDAYTAATYTPVGFTVSLVSPPSSENAYDLKTYKVIHAVNGGTATLASGPNPYGAGFLQFGLSEQSFDLRAPLDGETVTDMVSKTRQWTGLASDPTPPTDPQAFTVFTDHPNDGPDVQQFYPSISGGIEFTYAGNYGWGVTIPASTTPPMDERARDGFTATYDASWASPDPSFSKSVTVNTQAVLWQFFHVVEGAPDHGGGGGAPGAPQSLYGLAMDRHPFGVLRMVYNVGFDSTDLRLRRFYGLGSADPSDVALPFTGQSPSLLCRDDGRHLIAASDGADILVKLVDDEGTVIQTMPSPGSGKLCSIYESRADMVSPVWVAYCTADADTGDIKVYRSLDPVGLTGWEAAVTVATGVPAQKPAITGDGARLLISYHDGSAVLQIMASTDNGATWSSV